MKIISFSVELSIKSPVDFLMHTFLFHTLNINIYQVFFEFEIL